jgi:hypothetical protein
MRRICGPGSFSHRSSTAVRTEREGRNSVEEKIQHTQQSGYDIGRVDVITFSFEFARIVSPLVMVGGIAATWTVTVKCE